MKKADESFHVKDVLNQKFYTHGGDFLPLSVWATRGFNTQSIADHTLEGDKRLHPVLGLTYRVKILAIGERGEENVRTRHVLSRTNKRAKTEEEEKEQEQEEQPGQEQEGNQPAGETLRTQKKNTKGKNKKSDISSADGEEKSADDSSGEDDSRSSSSSSKTSSSSSGRKKKKHSHKKSKKKKSKKSKGSKKEKSAKKNKKQAAAQKKKEQEDKQLAKAQEKAQKKRGLRGEESEGFKAETRHVYRHQDDPRDECPLGHAPEATAFEVPVFDTRDRRGCLWRAESPPATLQPCHLSRRSKR